MSKQFHLADLTINFTPHPTPRAYACLRVSALVLSEQVLFLGTAVYNGSLKLPFLSYGDEYAMLQDESSTPGMRAPPSLATSALMKSPLLRRVSQEYESPAGALTLAARAAARREADKANGDRVGEGGRARASSSERQGLVRGQPGDPEYGSGR